MNTAQIFASLYLDKEVAEGTLKEYQSISIFGEVNTDQLSAYRPTHFRSLSDAFQEIDFIDQSLFHRNISFLSVKNRQNHLNLARNDF